MSLRDLAHTPTTSYVALNSVTDSDQTDVGIKWQNITVTNNTDVAVSIKNSGKSSVSGTGRVLAPSESFSYLELDTRECFVKAASTATGSVVWTFNQ